MDRFLDYFAGAGSLDLELGHFALCLLASFLFSVVVEALYVLFYEHRATGSQIHRSFLLIGPSVTLLFICIQLSLPLSLGLLGALSIVRFRTPVKEPEEIGFLMLLIATAIAVATFNFLFAVLLCAAMALALGLRRWGYLRRRWSDRRAGILTINLDSEVYAGREEALTARLNAFCKGLRLESISATESTTSLQYVFTGAVAPGWDALQRDLRRDIPFNKLNIVLA